MIDRGKSGPKYSNKSGIKHTDLKSVHPGSPEKDIKAINAANTPKKAPGSVGN